MRKNELGQPGSIFQDGQVSPAGACPSPHGDCAQLFWSTAWHTREGSAKGQYIPDGRQCRLVLEIPAGAIPPLRLDPASRPCFIEINWIRLSSDEPGQEQPKPVIAEWSAENGFAGLSASGDLVLLGSGKTLRLLSTGDDPQLFLDAEGLGDLSGGSVIEISMKALEPSRESGIDELLRLAEAIAPERDSEESGEEGKSLVELGSEMERGIRELEASANERLELYYNAAYELSCRTAELERIKRSAAGKAVDLFGRLKHAHLVPALNSLRLTRSKDRYEDPAAESIKTGHLAKPFWLALENTLDPIFRRRFYSRLRPLHQLETLENAGEWRSSGFDPQLRIEGDVPAGWARLDIHFEPLGAYSARSHLYLDRGMGFTQTRSYDLGEIGRLQTSYLELNPEVLGVRLDPIDGPGAFRIKQFKLRRVTRLEARVWEWLGRKRARAAALAAPGDSPGPDEAPRPVGQLAPFDAWLEVNQWNPRREELLRERMATLGARPSLSIIMPVYNPPPAVLDRAIQSVADQIYENWELCIADDASSNPAVRRVLEEWRGRDRRIKVTFREKNGNISAASN